MSESQSRRSPASRLPMPLIRTSLLVFGVGWLTATQLFSPSKRVIEAVAGVVVAGILWSYSTLGAVWFLVLLYPFPFAIYVGNSNFVFATMIFIIYLVRVSTGAESIIMDRKIRTPIALLVLAYVISFYNASFSTVLFRYGLVHTVNFFSAILFMIMIANLVDNEDKLEKTVKILAISAALIIAFTMFEMLFPGRVIVPNWLYTPHKTGLITKGLRMGGPFHDFELVAEFFAMHVLIFFFLFARSRRLVSKFIFMALLIIDLMMMFATITRGAFISLFIGVAYLMYLSRKEMNFVRMTTIIGAFVLMIFVLEFFVAQYTTSGSLFDRLLMTTFEKGVIPYNRVDAWGGAVEKGMKHPIIGNSPGWDFSKGLESGMWPHNVYLLYFTITGIFGLSAFLWLLYRLGMASLPGIRSSIVNSPFPEAFMKILHVCFVMFCIDQIKIEYVRNDKYVFFVWLFFGLIIATSNIIEKKRIGQTQAVNSSLGATANFD